MAGDSKNVWNNVELRIDADTFSHHVRYLQLLK